MLLARTFAAALIGAGLLRALPAAAAPFAGAPHFDAGRRAFERGQYELSLREMMLATLERPSDARAREYMRQAGERLIASDIDQLDGEHRDLFRDYRDTLEHGRLQAQAWTGWMLQARASAASGLWARAYDDASRILDDNPFHADAKDMQKDAIMGVARALAGPAMGRNKDWLIYRGIFFITDRQPKQARQALRDALALGEAAGELSDERVRYYLSRFTVPPVVAPIAAPVVAPIAAPVVAPKLPVARRKPESKPERKAPVTIAQPGQTAYAQGIVKLEAGLFEEAIELFERTLAEAPAHATAPQMLLRARLALEEETRRRKADAERLYGLGLVFYSQGQRVQAAEHLRRALAADPKHTYAARALARVEQELKEVAK